MAPSLSRPLNRSVKWSPVRWMSGAHAFDTSHAGGPPLKTGPPSFQWTRSVDCSCWKASPPVVYAKNVPSLARATDGSGAFLSNTGFVNRGGGGGGGGGVST